jgi:glycosyltransferase involved in cell wall biosynthesis
MRILFNTYPTAFDCPGGGEVQLLESKSALERLGHEVVLFDPWRPQFDEVDVVHFFSVQGGSMGFCDYVKKRGLPLLISPILWLTEENVKRFPMGEISDLLHLCDLILPNSGTERDLLSESFGLSRDKFLVTPNGVSPVGLSSADPFRAHFDIKGPFLLNVGNIEPRKNQLALIDAISDLKLELVLLGNVRDGAYFDRCVRDGEGFVSYLGHLEHDGELLVSAYRACEAFVLPSLLETPGLSAMEAGVQGTRVVVTSVGSTREYFQDLATYVDPMDPEDIRTGIVGALADDKDERLRKHLIANFTWDHAAKQLVEAYALASASARSR